VARIYDKAQEVRGQLLVLGVVPGESVLGVVPGESAMVTPAPALGQSLEGPGMRAPQAGAGVTTAVSRPARAARRGGPQAGAGVTTVARLPV